MIVLSKQGEIPLNDSASHIYFADGQFSESHTKAITNGTYRSIYNGTLDSGYGARPPGTGGQLSRLYDGDPAFTTGAFPLTLYLKGKFGHSQEVFNDKGFTNMAIDMAARAVGWFGMVGLRGSFDVSGESLL